MAADPSGEVGLVVSAIEKSYAPPFLMLGINLENTTSDQFQLGIAGRYLRFDVAGFGQRASARRRGRRRPGLGARSTSRSGGPRSLRSLCRRGNRTFNVIQEDAIVARYAQTLSKAGADFGLNLGRDSDLRLGGSVGWLDANVTIGDPGPAVGQRQADRGIPHLAPNTQDSAIVPSRGVNAKSQFTYTFDGPDAQDERDTSSSTRTSVGLPQFTAESNRSGRGAITIASSPLAASARRSTTARCRSISSRWACPFT